MEEIWKSIPIFDGRYYASSFGRIKVIKCFNHRKEKIIKGSISTTGYYTSVLSVNGVKVRYKHHRLVAMAFLEMDSIKIYVNHKNGIKTDNRVDNIEWCTMGENNLHAFRVLGKRPPMHRLGIKYDKNPLSKPVVQYSLIGEKIKEWASASEVESQLSINDGQISACCLHRKGHYTAGGFIWEFRDKN